MGNLSVPGLDQTGAAILSYASWAPSGHNSQPWTVKVHDERRWTIQADPSRRLPAVDPDNRELLLSLGAFTENLVLAAGALGLEAIVEVTASSSHERDIARVELIPGRPTGYPLRRLADRRTVKKGYQNRELSSAAVQKLEESFDGRLFYFPRESRHARCIADGAVEAFRHQSDRDPAQAELAAWIRFDDREAEKLRDGLTPAGMEITGLAGWYVRHFMSTQDVVGERFRKEGVDLTARLANEGAGWLVITSPGDRPADLIDTGRRFERMFLTLREQGLAIHPMTQQLEETAWRERIAGQHGSGMIPQFILRVGFPERYPAPVSLRRPAAWFTTKSDRP